MANKNTEITPAELEALLTQDEAVNERVLKAYALGQGDPSYNWIFQNRLKMASSIIRTFHCSIEDALRVLSVPKKDRPPIVNAITASSNQKANAKNNRAKHGEKKDNDPLHAEIKT